MHLTDDHADAYMALIGVRSPARFRERANFHHHRLALDDDGQVLAALYVEDRHGDLTLLHGPHLRHPGVPPAVSVALLAEALAVAHETAPPRIATRTLDSVDSPAFQAALRAAGFRNMGGRIEFTAPLAALVLEDDADSPLRWMDLEAAGMDTAAAAFAAAAVGDPHGLEENEEPAAVIRGYLAEGALSSAPSCVQVGFADGVPVAFVCAQVSAATGWSRISYMGLATAVRGRGWGRWVHRQGLAMLQAQGGTHYHGGTAAENGAMLHLFQQRGCQELRRMTEWLWSRPD